MSIQPLFLGLLFITLSTSCSSREGASPISEGEMAVSKIFKSNDINHDNCLSLSEWRRMAEIATKGIGNEASNVDQFRNSLLEAFHDIDRDKNGCITAEEYIQTSESYRNEVERNGI